MFTKLTLRQKYFVQLASLLLAGILVVFATDNIGDTLKQQLAHQQQSLSGAPLHHTPNAITAPVDNATSTLLLILALAGIFILSVTTLVNRAVCKPLHTLMDALNRISSGEGDLATRIPLSGNHEAARVATSYNEFAAKLQNVVDGVAHIAAKMEAETRQLAAVIDESAQHTSVQQREVDQIAAAMHEMAMSIQEVSANAHRVAASAQQADTGAATGQQLVQQNLQSSRDLAVAVEHSAEVMRRLEQESNNIGGVLDVIGAIADQTNLLALNAAIEAARAGEQGRGFAVVADEVRTLAQRTQDSTHEIQRLIENLQAGSREVAASMLENHRQMGINMALAEQTHDAIATISAAVSEIRDMTAQIAAATEQQGCVAESMSQNLSAVNTSSERIAEAAHQTAAFGQELVQLTEEQHRVMGQFRSSAVRGFDFGTAREAHLAWKHRLADFLAGKSTLTQSQAVSHHDCVLGKWYDGEGRKKYGDMAQFRAIEEPHAALHAAIRNIVQLKQDGNTTEAQRLYQTVEPISERIVEMLNALEQGIARHPA